MPPFFSWCLLNYISLSRSTHPLPPLFPTFQPPLLFLLTKGFSWLSVREDKPAMFLRAHWQINQLPAASSGPWQQHWPLCRSPLPPLIPPLTPPSFHPKPSLLGCWVFSDCSSTKCKYTACGPPWFNCMYTEMLLWEPWDVLLIVFIHCNCFLCCLIFFSVFTHSFLLCRSHWHTHSKKRRTYLNTTLVSVLLYMYSKYLFWSLINMFETLNSTVYCCATFFQQVASP